MCIAGTIACAAAQGVTPHAPADAVQQHDAAFRAMMADPGNLDKTFAYAQSAIAVGDLEGAVSALERMLFVNPNLPRIRLELGVLYYRLGSLVAAKQYFDSVLEQPDVPQPVRDRVDVFLAEIEKRETRHHFSGSLFVGLRFQTNANTATDTGNVLVGGVNATLDARFTSKKDWNLFTALSLKHSYDLDPAASDTWDTTLTSYVARQADQKQVAVSLVETTTGPTLKLFAGDEWDPTFRPYAITTLVAIEDVWDYWAPGIGASLTLTFLPVLQGEAVFEMRDRRFNNTVAQPNKTDRDGVETIGRLKFTYLLSPQLSVNFGPSVTRQNTDSDPDANTELGFTAGFAWTHPAPFDLTSQPWALVGSATRAFTKYDSIDATISPDQVRTDRDWRLTITQAVPLTPDWTVVTTLGRTLRTSTIPNFAFENGSVTVGASLRF
jgi:hypothetical protein